MARRIRFSSGELGRAALPSMPRVRASLCADGPDCTVARTVRNKFSARPKQSKPAPKLALDAGTRTSQERGLDFFMDAFAISSEISNGRSLAVETLWLQSLRGRSKFIPSAAEAALISARLRHG